MEAKFDSFCNSIGLSGPSAQTLKARFDEANKHGLTVAVSRDLACLAAQLSLGQDNVDVSPINQTLASKNWSQTCVFKPHCIYKPPNTAAVSKAIKIVGFFQVKFAVRSGGHSPSPGSSNIENGVLIDLQSINQITLDADKKAVSVGPGARWAQVFDTLEAHKTSVIGGRIPDVGVGGLMLGGGFFHFSGEFGLAADNVKNFEIVLADGTITNANANDNTELFWALKGGGPNFGIVTRYDLYTVPVWSVWYRWDTYAIDKADAILDAMAKWQSEGASDLKSTVALIMSLDSIVVGLIYSAPTDNPSVFAPFYEIQPVTPLVAPTNGTVKTLTDFLADTFSDKPLRHDYRASSSKIDAQLYKDVWNFWKGRAKEVRDATDANQTFTIQPIMKNMVEQGIAKGGNPMGIPSQDHQWWTTVIDWKNGSDDDVVRSVSIDTSNAWQKLGQERGLDLSHIFMNDASRDQSPLTSYGKENVAKLKEIALQYDKDQVFQKLQNGGFLLSNA
ncbi:FAD-binding domain-containing protein [Nemania sp. FL0031]|nr:FAD-binding domain-containing protein [Nemania sp. FL0031]